MIQLDQVTKSFEGKSRVTALDEAEEVGMLGEIRLELSKTRTRPILQPRLGDVILDAVEATLAH